MIYCGALSGPRDAVNQVLGLCPMPHRMAKLVWGPCFFGISGPFIQDCPKVANKQVQDRAATRFYRSWRRNGK